MTIFKTKNSPKLENILLDGGYIGQEDIEKCLKIAKDRNVPLEDVLISERFITPDIIGQAVAESFGVEYADLNTNTPNLEQILKIPEEIAKKYRIIFFEEKPKSIIISTDEIKNPDLAEVFKTLFPDKKVKLAYSLSPDIDDILGNYHKNLETSFANMILKNKKVTTIEIVDQIIEDAVTLKASDIHCEPQDKTMLIRFRIDGVLHDAGEIPIEYYENVLNRFKVLARLRIDEHFSPQDGAIRFTSKNGYQSVDLRVSVVPTLDGEKIAIRVLSSYVQSLSLGEIGLTTKLQEQILKSASKPFGMILVTGSTGSGKTTTLYSLLKQLNTREVNITTIEDPVEYRIKGINQIQTNQQSNLTFAKGLRAIARQDPNVVLVGEIRDLETADIAVNAALTGHLLLSTFHANNAATAIPRFIDMGIEPFLVSSTLELVIAQRLVRRLCDKCRVSYTVSKSDLMKYGSDITKLFSDKNQTLYHSKGCSACAGTGFKGRIGIFEYICSTPELQDLISKHPSTKEVLDLVKEQNFAPLIEDGIEKVKSGLTSLEELLRVVSI